MKKRTVQIKKLSRQVTIMYPEKEGMIVHPRLEQSWQVLDGTRTSSSAQGRTVLAGTKSASLCLLKGGALRTGAPGWRRWPSRVRLLPARTYKSRQAKEGS